MQFKKHFSLFISYPGGHCLQISLLSFNSQLKQFLSEHFRIHLFSCKLYFSLHSIHFPLLSKHFIQFLSHEKIKALILEYSSSIILIFALSDDNIGLSSISSVLASIISSG